MQTLSVPSSFSALRTRSTNDGISSELESTCLAELSTGEVVIRNRFAGVNYKDCLSIQGRAKIIASFPRIAGIEIVGEVVESSHASFSPGQAVMVHGFQTGIAFDGGFSEYMRAPASHVMHLPDRLSMWEAAMMGVVGFTAAMALEHFEELGVTPDAGIVGISGATGAVGILSTALFAHAGYRVAAITRKIEDAKALQRLGAYEVIDASGIQHQTRPLEKGRFAAVIDNVGGPMLSWLLRSLQDGGVAAAVGNAAGNNFEANVLPFILRGVQMFGIVANASWPTRQRLWNKLANEWKPDFSAIEPHIHTIQLQDLMAYSKRHLEGKTSGRTLISY